MPILNSNLIPDLRTAVALEASLRVILHDEMSLRTTGAVDYLGSINGTLSDTSQVRLAGLDGFDPMQVIAPAEDTPIVETLLTDASVPIAVARAGIRRDISDLAVLTGVPGSQLDPMRLAYSMVGAYEQFFNVTAAAAIGGLAGVPTGAPMIVTDFYTAIFALEVASVPRDRGYYALLAPQQLADFQSSLRTEGGAVGFQYYETVEQLKIKGQGFVGEFLGVDIYKSDKITGPAFAGGMWGGGCMGFKNGIPAAPLGGVVISPGGEIMVEFARNAAASTTEVIGTCYLGLSVIEAARGAGIQTS